MVRKIFPVFLCATMVGFVACGDDDDNDNNNTTDGTHDPVGTDLLAEITISGVVKHHPFNIAAGGGSVPDLTGLKVAVVAPADLMENPSAPPRGAVVLDGTAPQCTAADPAAIACPYSIANVNVERVAPGIATSVIDSSDVFVMTGTGAANTETVDKARAKDDGELEGRQSLVLSKEALNGIVAAITGTTDVDALVANGFILATVLKEDAATGKLLPVQGASLTPANGFTFYYVNEAFNGVTSDSKTAKHGSIIAVPDFSAEPKTKYVSLRVTGDGTWDPQTAGTTPGAAYCSLVIAD